MDSLELGEEQCSWCVKPEWEHTEGLLYQWNGPVPSGASTGQHEAHELRNNDTAIPETI